MSVQKLFLNPSGIWQIYYGGDSNLVQPPVTRSSLNGLQGTYKPSYDTVGVPAGTTLAPGPNPNGTITISGSTSVTYENLEMRNDIDVRTTGQVTIRNCYIRGWNKQWASDSAWIRCDSNPGNRNVLIEDCWIKPDYPTTYADGIIGCDFTARRNLIQNCNDGMGLRRPGNFNSDNRTRVYANWIRDMSYFTPDLATPRPNTHNDGIQIFAGWGMDIVGNVIWANASDSAGTPPYGIGTGSGANPYPPNVGQGIAITPSVNVPVTGVTIDRNWFDWGGNASITVTRSTDTTLTTTATITNNNFGRNQWNLSRDGVVGRRPILIDNLLTLAGFPGGANSVTTDNTNGNVWEDTASPILVYKGAF